MVRPPTAVLAMELPGQGPGRSGGSRPLIPKNTQVKVFASYLYSLVFDTACYWDNKLRAIYDKESDDGITYLQG